MKVYRSVAAVCVATALAASAWAQSGLRPAQPMQPAPSKARQPAAAQPAAAQPAAAPAATRRAAPRSGAVDYIVAVVNDEVITRAELDVKLEIAERQVRQQGTTLPRNVLERQVLERVIAERVQEQQAKTIGLTVEDTQVDRAIQRIAEQNNLSLNDFRDRLEKDGIPFERFRRDVRQEILFVRLREREVDNRIQVSEGEIDNFLAERAGAPTGGVEISLAQILVRVPEGSSPEVIARQRAKAEDMVRQLRGGADFAKMAVAFSDSPDALKGGEMGFRIQERWPQLFLEAIRDLQPGGVSNLVQSPAGFHILKLVNKRAAAQPAGAAQALATAPVQQTRARHILIRVNELISTQEAQRRLTDIRQRIANGTKFEDMAKQYSVDGNAAQGGDLGWLYPGDAVPEFQRVMDSLKPGEISQPVETNFGWHLIQVLERRTQDVSSERQRLVARQALRERKADDAYDDWLRQLRDRAYVEIRLENPNT